MILFTNFTKILVEEGYIQLLTHSAMNEQIKLRKAVSEAATEIEKYSRIEHFKILNKIEEVKQVECVCCGLQEDCTLSYILQIEESFSGKWVCGLCSEAVKEIIKRSFPKIAIEKAVSFHRDFCQSFNSTTRLNPKLSLTFTMREIAKRSSENRKSKHMAAISKLARSSSCVARINLKN